jgi:hypothetical protein
MQMDSEAKSTDASRQSELKQLLAPITEFFIRAGFADWEIQLAVEDSISQARRCRRPFVVKRVGDAELYAAIVRRWTVQPAYANEVGRPAILAISGRRSFTTLARQSGYKGSVSPLIDLMTEHGSIQTTNKGTVELVLTHMKHYRPAVLSYEWNYQFLLDAITAATRGMGKPGNSRRQLVSFVNVANNIDAKHVTSFLLESRRRNVAFASELSPWLEHVSIRSARKNARRGKTYRLGVAVFPICGRE